MDSFECSGRNCSPQDVEVLAHALLEGAVGGEVFDGDPGVVAGVAEGGDEGAKVDDAWAPHLWGERILFWSAYAPYILSSTDTGYRSALLNTLARGARHIEANAEKAPTGLDRIAFQVAPAAKFDGSSV